MRISNLLTLSCALLILSGCATLQKQLEPLVCQCELADSCEPAPRDMEIATAIALHQVGTAHHRAHAEYAYQAPVGELHEAVVLAAEDPEAPEEQALPAEVPAEPRGEAPRRARREQAQAPPSGAGDAVSPIADDHMIPLTTAGERETFAAAYGINPPAGSIGFQGVFDRSGQSSVAILEPGLRLRFYRDGSLVAQHQFTDQVPLESMEELAGILPHGAAAVNILDGPIHHLQLVHAVAGEDDSLTYYLGLHKMIGQFVGTSFYQPIARRSAQGDVQPLAAVRYIQGEEHRTIEWITLDADGQPLGEPVLYEWNRWEGVFRLPGLPPTAPTREDLRS